MEKIVELVDNLAKTQGINKTYLPQVHVYRSSSENGRSPLLYNQGIIFVVQGEKKVYTEKSVYTYNPDNYIVITVPLPLECEGFNIDGKDLLGLVLDIEIPTLNNIINSMGDTVNFGNFDTCQKKCGLFTAQANQDFKDIIYRLVKALQNPIDTKVLGESILKELIFQVMKEESSAPLYALAMKNTNLSKIEVALKEMHSNYDQPMDVDGLAKVVNMSVSSFHHTFKDVTSSSPIQYLKKLRLTKAKTYISEDGLRVNEAARKVGYESVSQFSREFKRYYGAPPKEYVR
jgi:AraC-like DNA-binding protein